MVKIIAYYLPQYHPIPENNGWWGNGFTEWTNVAKAKPLFRHHLQPKIPKDLGFYDLRIPEVREAQAELAREAGVYGFCYWHYWFGNGKQLLEYPINEVVKTGKPDFPFCLGWANDSWLSKSWNTQYKSQGKILIEQQYPGDDDIINHFKTIIPIISDKRYIRIDNRPLFVIYRPLLIPDFPNFKSLWNKLIKESGIADSFFFVAYSIDEKENSRLLNDGFDAINMLRLGAYRFDPKCIRENVFKLFRYKTFHYPLRLKYSKMIKHLIKKEVDSAENIFPSILPNWDHTPRSGKRGVIFEGSTPKLFMKHAEMVIDAVRSKPSSKQIIFLKSWNEWGEGNYMEPDLQNGKEYIWALKKAIDKSINQE